jgi:hypothetical protein
MEWIRILERERERENFHPFSCRIPMTFKKEKKDFNLDFVNVRK